MLVLVSSVVNCEFVLAECFNKLGLYLFCLVLFLLCCVVPVCFGWCWFWFGVLARLRIWRSAIVYCFSVAVCFLGVIRFCCGLLSIFFCGFSELVGVRVDVFFLWMVVVCCGVV